MVIPIKIIEFSKFMNDIKDTEKVLIVEEY